MPIKFHRLFANFKFYVNNLSNKILPKNCKYCSKSSLSYNHGHNILRLLILYQVFFSPQVKRSVIIRSKHGTLKLPPAGGAFVRTQEKKKKKRLHFRRWGGQGAHTRKKKRLSLGIPYSPKINIFPILAKNCWK